MNVSVELHPTTASTGTVAVVLLKNEWFGTTIVGSFTMGYDAVASHTFTGLSSSDKYFVRMYKPNDYVILWGGISIS